MTLGQNPCIDNLHPKQTPSIYFKINPTLIETKIRL